MLKSPTLIMSLLISPSSSINFVLHNLGLLHLNLELLYILRELKHLYLMAVFVLNNVFFFLP